MSDVKGKGGSQLLIRNPP